MAVNRPVKVDTVTLDIFAPANRVENLPHTRSATSKAAAARVSPITAHNRRRRVFEAIRDAERGLARFQIAQRLGVPQHWITSSVDALIKQGTIAETGRTMVNPESGVSCAVLVARSTRNG